MSYCVTNIDPFMKRGEGGFPFDHRFWGHLFVAASWHPHPLQGTAPKSVVFGPGAVGRKPKLDKVTALSVAMTGLLEVGPLSGQ